MKSYYFLHISVLFCSEACWMQISYSASKESLAQLVLGLKENIAYQGDIVILSLISSDCVF